MRKTAMVIMALTAILVGSVVGSNAVTQSAPVQVGARTCSTASQALNDPEGCTGTPAYNPRAQEYVTWNRVGEGYVHSTLHLY